VGSISIQRDKCALTVLSLSLTHTHTHTPHTHTNAPTARRPLPVHSMVERITFIATQENVKLAPGALDSILQNSGGDMRKAVTFLQTSHQLSCSAGYSADGIAPMATSVVTPAMVVDIAGAIPPECMADLWAGKCWCGRVGSSMLGMHVDQSGPSGVSLIPLHRNITQH